MVACQDAAEQNHQEEEAFQDEAEAVLASHEEVEEVLSSYHQAEEPLAFDHTEAVVQETAVAVAASYHKAEEDLVPSEEDLDHQKPEAAEASVLEVA